MFFLFLLALGHSSLAFNEEKLKLLPTTDSCGNEIEQKIYGGQNTDLDEFPWMALLNYKNESNGNRIFLCGGFLISKRYILTAAHCIGHAPPDCKLISVRLGEHDTTQETDCHKSPTGMICASKPENFDVEKYVVHENYNKADKLQNHDIALIRLNREVQFTNYISPICLPTSPLQQNRSIEGKNSFIAGWGFTQHGPFSNVKLKAKVPVKANVACNDVFRPKHFQITERQICAGGEVGVGSCKGDSGGPLMTPGAENDNVNWYAFGIISFGHYPCAQGVYPTVYTRITKYIDWILDKIEP